MPSFALPSLDSTSFAFMLGVETARGTVMGLGGLLVVHGVSAAAGFLDNLRGAHQAQALFPELGSSPLAQLQVLVTVAAIFQLGGPVWMLEALGDSLRQVPLGTPLEPDISMAVVTLWSNAFRFGMLVVVPGVVACLWVDLVFGLLNRMAPKANAYVMALGLKSGLALLAFGLALPWMAAHLPGELMPLLTAWSRLFFRGDS